MMSLLTKQQTTKALIADLANYTSNFEKAIIQFHKHQMQDINLKLRELWTQIYSNSDIDYISIESNAESESKSYDYRVIMHKSNVPVTMKGRCSAGQKVIASLIIRLAIAQVISKKCHLFALDEPTTNLDAKNCESLAEALAKILMLQNRHNNFQLILITHDENFVSLLRTRCVANYYYNVKRAHGGFSEIYQSII
ncbi:DNA repair protein RAD50.L-like [Dermatophagoides farinae]|uniref:DNA repair protein RAD50.L-like n=1 Tax=Dermatophagoides farinae TaxID=6954 RepID=UPI003F632F94